MYAWRHKETGKWLVIDQSRTHVKLYDTYSYVDDINLASVALRPPRPIRDDVEPVEVRVTRFVEIIKP